MTERFCDVSAVTLIGDGHYSAGVAPGWDIAGNANGGYVLAMIGRAIAAEVGRPPATITAHYLSPVVSGEVEIAVEVIRGGRTFATARASMFQGGRRVIEALGTFGQIDQHPVELVDGGPPDLPPFDDESVIPSAADIEVSPSFHSRVDVRLRPGDAGFRQGRKSHEASIAGWFDFHADEPIDEIALLLVSDAFAPPVFNLDVPIGWVPTVELTVHIRAVPAPGPLRCRFHTKFISAGRLAEDGELWDADGNLVALSRQMALVPRAEGL